MDARDRVQALEEQGLEGCAHARPGTGRCCSPRPSISMRLALSTAASARTSRSGDDVHTWPVGQRLRVGGAEFEITMVCDPCSRMDEIRPGLQQELDGRRGMLARVVQGGEVAAGAEIELL